MPHKIIVVCLGALLVLPVSGLAQERRVEVGGQVAIARIGAFDDTDIGFGVRAGWRPTGILGIEGEVNVYPDDFPSTGLILSRSRLEALFGVTVGPRLGAVRPFAKVRPGLLSYRQAPLAFACIAVFPAPLSCEIAGGRRLFAVDVGGGVDVSIGSRMLVRFDIGDRLMRYPEPHGIGHDVRAGAGWAWRF